MSVLIENLHTCIISARVICVMCCSKVHLCSSESFLCLISWSALTAWTGRVSKGWVLRQSSKPERSQSWISETSYNKFVEACMLLLCPYLVVFYLVCIVYTYKSRARAPLLRLLRCCFSGFTS